MTTNFSTEFPINPERSVTDVLNLACEWIAGSPHTKMKLGELNEIPTDAERTISTQNEQVTIALANDHDYDIGGLRYVCTDQGLEWTTSIVTHRTVDRHLLSIQVSCEAMNATARLPPPKKPYFIRQALDRLGGGMDGDIPVTDKAIFLSEGEASIAAALMKGLAKNKLPIIYISVGFDGYLLVNPKELAQYVSGMAHVIVEPSRQFSYQVKTLTDSHNVFGGTIGVYWPESEARRSYFVEQGSRPQRAILIEIAKDIRLALANRRLRATCTWGHLQETISRKRYDSLKSQGSTELQKYIDAFDADQAAKDGKLIEAEQEISRLHAEIRRLSAIAESSTTGLITTGKEQDLYPNEIRDIIITALRDSLRVARENSRRQHILQDLLAFNKSSDSANALGEKIKSLFRSYRDMDTPTRNSLLGLGFEISEDGKHYKMTFQGDRRYTFTLPKTSSDHRAGKNIASDINNILI